jgi:enediyne biosynthesis protein E4
VQGERFEAVTLPAGIDTAALYSHGVTIGDYNNDGFQDLLVTGYGPPQLWRNMGDGTFVESAAAAGITDSRWASSAGWADLNGDGHLDLYLTHYVNWSFENHPYCPSGRPGVREICPPRDYEPLPDTLYYSRGDGTFEDATAFAGLREDGKGLGVLLCDVDLDGDVDIYVANDTTDNFLYLNDGQGRFREQGIVRGVAVDAGGIPNGSMGVDLCDFNGDGLPDLWVANYEQESFALYRNEGNGLFLHVSQRFGITDLGGLFVGFGTACDDFSGDGREEFIVTNGHVIKYPNTAPRRQLPLLLEYDGRRFQRARFEEGTYFEQAHEGRGLAAADFDRDGDLDIAISHINEPLALLENRFREHSRGIALSLVGTHSNRDAVGARVEFTSTAGRRVRQVTGGGSYLSHSSRTLHFALAGDAQPQQLVVHWPAGEVQTIDAADLAGEIILIEPRTAGQQPPRLYGRQVQR